MIIAGAVTLRRRCLSIVVSSMAGYARLFRDERLDELPAIMSKGGFRVLSRRSAPDASYFECRSAGGVDIMFWVTLRTTEKPAMFHWRSGKGFVDQVVATGAASPLIALLTIGGFFLDEGAETKS